MTIRKKILFSIFCFLLLLPSLGLAQSLFPSGYWGPLVSCTGNYSSGSNPCVSLCDLIQTFLNVIYFGMTLVVFVLTPVLFAWGGITILLAAGDPGKLQSGKKILTGTLIGLGIVLFAFLIVSTFIKFLGVQGYVQGFDSNSGSFTCTVQQ